MNREKERLMVNLVSDCIDRTTAIKRYLRFVMKFWEFSISPLKNPLELNEAVKQASICDFMIVDAFINGHPRGFAFSKAVEKNALLLSYAGEIPIEEEGPFWLVLPRAIECFSNKIAKTLNNEAPSRLDFENLETRFSALKEQRNHLC